MLYTFPKQTCFLVSIYILAVISGIQGSKAQNSISVMSYNIRYDNNGDCENKWSCRKNALTLMLNKYHPDIIGLQEVLHNQKKHIAGKLKDYEGFGVGRDNGKRKGEYAPVFFNKSIFEKTDGHYFWLSETPEKAGSKSWDAACTRIVTWCKLTHKQSGKIIFIFNTHFDHIGKIAREKSALLIIERIKAIAGNYDFILTGDLNTGPLEEAYQNLMNSNDILFTDAAGLNNTEGTFCGFEVKNTDCKRIDYILLSKTLNSKNYTVVHDNNGTYYPSDHMPVITEVGF